MNDPLDKSQSLSVVDDFKIPTRAEHNRFVRNIWKLCIGSAIFIFFVTGSVVLTLFLRGYDSKKIVEVSTSIFQVLVLSYGMGFFVPAFCTSLIKMSLGVEMSRKGLEIGEKTARVLDELDKAVVARLERVDALFGRLEKMVDQVERGDHPILAQLEQKAERLALDIKAEGRKIHEELEKLAGAFTRPIRPPPAAVTPGVAPPGNGQKEHERQGSVA